MLILFIILFFIVILYILATFTNFPILSDVRVLWIETAMTTADHQWLATKFFPKFIIKDVMNKKVEDIGIVGITEISKESKEILLHEGLLLDLNIPLSSNISGIIFSDEDEFGNLVIVNDKEQGIKIVEVKTAIYTGKLVFIDDPSRVIVGETENKYMCGELILNYLEQYDAIVGVNANGFSDYAGKGSGGEIIGCSISNGELWENSVFSAYTTIGFDCVDRLVVGKLANPFEYNLRDAAQFKPALIVNGKILEECMVGWGLQPRTIIAQRADGVVMFLVVDGRKVGYSMGITMSEAAKLLLSYGAVTAAACDGGSSSVLAYDGNIINKPSTPMKTGRYIPNAFLVKRK